MTDFTETLEKNNIEYRVEKVPQILDSGIIGTDSNPDVVLKLKPEDFEKAHKSLETYYAASLEQIDKDHYLYSFSDEELLEIVQKPDEWGYIDYLLAQKILASHDIKIDEKTLKDFKTERAEALAKPERASFFLFLIAYLSVSTGIVYTISPLSNFNDFIFFSSVAGFFIGRHIFLNKKTLPDGQSVLNYVSADRNHGRKLMYIALVVFFVSAIKYLVFIFTLDN